MLDKLTELASILNSRGLLREAKLLSALAKEASYRDALLEDRNYMMDPRANAKSAWKGYDERSGTITISWTKYLDDDDMTQDPDTGEWTEEKEIELNLPAELEVCSLCGGKGKTVDPNIDAGGLTSDDFYDDPDFEEDYFGGTYDITCAQCEGKRVVPVVAEGRLSVEQKKQYEEYAREQAEAAEEEYHERRERMGEMGLY